MLRAGTTNSDSARYDMVRAIVSAFSWRDFDTLVPTSTLAVQHELQRRNQMVPANEILGDLFELRDLQRIKGGYWIPSSTHLAISADIGLVVSGLPTQELDVEIGPLVNSIGASRFVRSGELERVGVPKIPLLEWLASPVSTRLWVEDMLRTVHYIDPYGMEAPEVYRHWKMSSPVRWMRLDNMVSLDERVVLARHQSRDRRSNYYLLRVRDRRVIAMHELSLNSDDVVRLMCGLRSIGDDPLICRVAHETNGPYVRVRVGMLPGAERRLLMALGQLAKNEQTFGMEAVVPDCTLTTVLDIIEALGCKVEMEVP